jgi:hypothetical protein
MKLDKVNWYEVYKSWTMNSGIFEYLFKSSPFVTAKYMNNFELNLNKNFSVNEGLIKVLKNYTNKDKMLLIDAETALGVKLAVALNNELKIAPILSYNFLFHPYGVVGGKELIEDLIYAAQVLRPVETASYAFIMDNNRYIEDLDIDNPMIFNNQYEITDEEMPDVNTLIRLGIKEVTLLYKNTVKEDIASYLDFLKENNFAVSTIDLGELLNE